MKFKRFGGNNADIAYGVAVDSSDNVLITGSFSQGLSIGASVLTNLGGLDIFLARLTTDLEPIGSAQSFGGSGTDIARSVAVNSKGDVALTGSFQGNVTFGGGTLAMAPNNGTVDGFVAVLDSSFAGRWTTSFGGSNATESDSGRRVAFDLYGNLIVSGAFVGTTDLGAGTVSSRMGDVFLTKYKAGSGVGPLVAVISGDTVEESYGMAVGPSGEVVLTGSTNSTTLKLGPTSFPQAGDSDYFILKMEASDTPILP